MISTFTLEIFVIVMTNFPGMGITVKVFVKLRQGSGKDRQGMALKAKGLKA